MYIKIENKNGYECWKKFINFLFQLDIQNSCNQYLDIFHKSSSITNNLPILAVFFIHNWRNHGHKHSLSVLLFPDCFDQSAELFFLLLCDLAKGVQSTIGNSSCLILSITNKSRQFGDIKYNNVREANFLILNIDKFNQFKKNGIQCHGKEIFNETFGAHNIYSIILFYAYYAIEDYDDEFQGWSYHNHNTWAQSIDILFSNWTEYEFTPYTQALAFSGFDECVYDELYRKGLLVKEFFFRKISRQISIKYHTFN